jgi:hypothetical protein
MFTTQLPPGGQSLAVWQPIAGQSVSLEQVGMSQNWIPEGTCWQSVFDVQ